MMDFSLQANERKRTPQRRPIHVAPASLNSTINQHLMPVSPHSLMSDGSILVGC